MHQEQLPSEWKFQKKPQSITRSYSFESYQDTSKFLEELADLSEQMNLYPNLNFTRTQVNVNIDVEGNIDELSQNQSEYGFAKKADSLIALSPN